MSDETVEVDTKQLTDTEAGDSQPENGKGEQADAIKEMVASAVKEATGPLMKTIEELKANNSGLHKRISEQEKEKAELEQSKKTVEERVSDIERQAAQKEAELAKERLIRQLHGEADKRGLVLEDEFNLDKFNLTLEEGIAQLDRKAERWKEREKKIVNDLITNGHKPGSGSTPEDDKLPFDPFDTSPENVQKAIAYTEKQLAG